MDKNKKKMMEQADFWIPFLLFLLLFLFKVLVVIENRSLPLIFDEFKYEKMSRLLLKNGSYHSVQYPLFYPLALMPAYLFGEHYYTAMKALNAGYSSLVPVFYHLDKVVLSTDKEDIKAKRYYVLTDEFEKYKDTGKEIASYQWEGKEYRLIETGS